MLRKTFALAALAALAVLPAVAQEAAETEMTLEEVLSAHYDALGGLEAIQSIDTARFEGSMSLGQGIEAPFTMTFSRPDRVRLEFTFQGMTAVQAFDGETAWMIMPFMGKPDPEMMPADQARQLEEQADLDGPLVDWEEKGHQVELVGLEEMEGTDAYHLKVTLANGDVRHFYLDSEYFVTIKQEAKTTMQGNEVEVETTLSDYKEVDGVLFPHSIESRPKGAPQGQAITIAEIEVGVDVDESSFEMPEPEPAPETEEESDTEEESETDSGE